MYSHNDSWSLGDWIHDKQIMRAVLHAYSYLQLLLFRGVCLNYSHPGPRREWSRVGSCSSCATLGPYCANTAEFREVVFCAQARYLRATCSELGVHFAPKVIPSSPWEPKAPQVAQRNPKGAKGKPKWRQREPLGSPRRSKGSPKSRQVVQNEFHKHQEKPTNQKTIYT